MFELDKKVIDYLLKIPIKESGLFNNKSEEIEAQLDMLSTIFLSSGDIKRVLEIGTNKGFFDYLILKSIPGVFIDTVDINYNSRRAVDYLNKDGNFITFHNKSSEEYFKSAPVDAFDLVWVDGSHVEVDCYNDLCNCSRLNIRTIILDDFRSNINVMRAMVKFLKNGAYEIVGMSRTQDSRGIAWLIRK